MKGVLFNIVEDVVSEALSADAWDDVIDRSGVRGSYTSLGNYPDDDLAGIVGAAAAVADMSEDDTLRLSGRAGFKHLVRRAPHLLDGLDVELSVEHLTCVHQGDASCTMRVAEAG
jgi:hypothetical protein